MKTLTIYVCDHCGKDYEDKKKAQACERRCRKETQKEEKAEKKQNELGNLIRLEAECLADIPKLLKKYAKKHMGLSVTIKEFPDQFAECSNTHCAPIDGVTNWNNDSKHPTDYLGWRGNWKGKVRGKKGADLGTLFGEALTDLDLGFTFNGFHCGTGCPGEDFDISGAIFLDDFPKIKEKFEELKKLDKARIRYDREEGKRTIKYCKVATKTLEESKELQKVLQEMEKLEEQRQELCEKAADIKKNITEKIIKQKRWKVPNKFNYVKKRYEQLLEEVGVSYYRDVAVLSKEKC